MRIKISKTNYSSKPTVEDMKFTVTRELRENKCIDVKFEELLGYISKGHSFILADYDDRFKSIMKEHIKSISCIALDIDSKEKPIKMDKMIKIIENKLGITPVISYYTFSDVDNTKFRLIYKLDVEIDVEVYQKLYKALQWKIKQLDQQTSNANRVWAGTCNAVLFNSNSKGFSFELIIKLINSYEAKLKRDNKVKKIEYKENFSKYDGENYIKSDYKQEISEYIIQNVNLVDFIQRHFGGSFKKDGKGYVGRCVLHGGDNKAALYITDRIYTCFTKCGTGNIFTLAKKVYGVDNFSQIVFRIANEYNLSIPAEYIVEVK